MALIEKLITMARGQNDQWEENLDFSIIFESVHSDKTRDRSLGVNKGLALCSVYPL